MITGKVATGMYWGGILTIITCLIGVFILAARGVDIPETVVMVLTSAIGFVFGTYVAPSSKSTDVPPEAGSDDE